MDNINLARHGTNWLIGATVLCITHFEFMMLPIIVNDFSIRAFDWIVRFEDCYVLGLLFYK